MLDNKPKSTVSVTLYFIACLLVWAGSIQGVKADDTRLFVSGSMSQILNARQGQPFLMAVWSIACPPCIVDLNLIANTLRENPRVDIVMISMDDASYTQAVQTMLIKYGLGSNVESWIFAEAYAPRLRYEIDSTWYGELPRTYFYEAHHNRRALSGGLRQQDIEDWIAKTGR